MKRLLTNIQKKNTFFAIFFFIFLSMGNLQGQTLEITIEEQSSYTDTIAIPILLDSVIQIGSITLGIEFDTTALEFLTLNEDGDLSGIFFHNQQNNVVIAAWFSLNPIIQADTFAIAYFKKKENVCNAPVTWANLSNELVTDEFGAPITVIKNNGYAYFLYNENPTLTYPAPNEINIPVNTLFRWNGSNLSCVKQFRYQLATDANFTQVISDTIIIDTVLAVTNMQELTNHYWRVGKVDDIDDVYWSNSQSFTTKDLDTTNLVIPDRLAFLDTILVPIILENEETVSAIQLGINYDTTAFQLMNSILTTATPLGINIIDTIQGRIDITWQSQDYPILLPADTILFLQFSRKDNCTGAISFDTINQWSNLFFYNTIPINTAFQSGTITFVDTITTNLIFPLDSSEQVFIRPELQWDSIGCSNNYRVQIAWNANMTNLLTDSIINTLVFVPTNLEGDTTFYWRVGRYNVIDSLFWSDVWEFKTEEVLPVFLDAQNITIEADTFDIPLTINGL
jgi:hypothetical protein